MHNENIIDNDFKENEEYGLDMFYDKSLDDPPCDITLPVEGVDEIKIANNNEPYDESTFKQDINMHTSFNDSHNVWVQNALGEYDSTIAPTIPNSLYDSTLDDGPNLLDKSPHLEIVTTLCGNKNSDGVISSCNDTPIHASPTFFLSSTIHTLEEKFSYVEKYLCGLKSSCTNNHYTHNNNVYDFSCNCFERGKHANEFHNKIKDPLYVPKVSKLHDPHSYIDEFASTCNYYKRGGTKNPLYVFNKYMLQVTTVNMHCEISIYCDSFIYKMPMHRKRVRLKS